MPTSILVVEDDESFGRRLTKNLQLDGFESQLAGSAYKAIEILKKSSINAIICDVKMPGMSGIELLSQIRQNELEDVDPDIPFLVLTSLNSVETAVEAMQKGASDYLTKDAGRGEIIVRLKKALSQRSVIEENKRLKESIAKTNEFGDLIGQSEVMERIKEDIDEVALLDTTILITGETGVGKELVARAIHERSNREGQFIDVNGALLPDDMMLQSELFGHEKGAFTDAKESRKGKFELADGGTLFLDEVGELSLDVQAKLLRALETMTFTRVGGSKPVKVDVRIILATNRDLEKEVQAGRFRDDLYYRINVFPIQIHPLRKRKSDIEELAQHFLKTVAERSSRPIPNLDADAMEMIKAYDWPGNIRELRNICERLLIRARGDVVITAADVERCGLQGKPAQSVALEIPDQGLKLDDLEKQLVIESLRKTNWNQTEAARLLGISTDRMNNRVKKFGLTHSSWRVNK